MANAIELTNVSKVYRRYSQRRQFATLKSALLSRSMVRDLNPDETFRAVHDLSVALALILSALTVHFRDIKDILANLMTLWFFATPIIYYWKFAPLKIRRFLDLNPFTHLAISYQEILYFPGDFGHWKWLLALGAGSAVLFLFAYFLFDRLRDSFAEEV